jgi:hypothetical protein
MQSLSTVHLLLWADAEDSSCSCVRSYDAGLAQCMIRSVSLTQQVRKEGATPASSTGLLLLRPDGHTKPLAHVLCSRQAAAQDAMSALFLSEEVLCTAMQSKQQGHV